MDVISKHDIARILIDTGYIVEMWQHDIKRLSNLVLSANTTEEIVQARRSYDAAKSIWYQIQAQIELDGKEIEETIDP